MGEISVVLFLVAYILPIIIAFSRSHHKKKQIVAVNLGTLVIAVIVINIEQISTLGTWLLGLGWLYALALSLTKNMTIAAMPVESSGIDNNTRKSNRPLSGMSWIIIIIILIIGTILSESVKLYFKPEIDDIAKNMASQFTTIKDKTAFVRKLAIEINKTMPQMPDKDTRVESVIAVDNKIQFNYTLINADVNDISKHVSNTKMRNSILNVYCTSKPTQFYVKNNITIIFSYKDMNGVGIIDIIASPSDC